MPKNILKTDASTLTVVPKPDAGGGQDGRSYAVVGHDFIINQTRKKLDEYGFLIKDELYTSNINGQVAQGVYHLNHSEDPELGLMFAWGNSYNKSMKFRCAVGAYVFVCGNGIIAGDMSNYGRKHVGEAKEEVKEHIDSQIKMASKYYNQLVADKNVMKKINLSDEDMCKLLGKLYIVDEVITSSQLILFKEQLAKPSYDYGTDEKCLWTIYNHITYTLKKSHPNKWMDAQKDLHKIVKAMFFPKTAVLDPNQLDLTEEVEKIENIGVEVLPSIEESSISEVIEAVSEPFIETADEEPVVEQPEEEVTFSLDSYDLEEEEVIEEETEDDSNDEFNFLVPEELTEETETEEVTSEENFLYKETNFEEFENFEYQEEDLEEQPECPTVEMLNLEVEEEVVSETDTDFETIEVEEESFIVTDSEEVSIEETELISENNSNDDNEELPEFEF